MCLTLFSILPGQRPLILYSVLSSIQLLLSVSSPAVTHTCHHTNVFTHEVYSLVSLYFAERMLRGVLAGI